MSMTVKRRRDVGTPRVFMHKVADIRGGVSIASSELGGDYVAEGTVISAPVDGICHVVKIAVVGAAVDAAATEVKVGKHSGLKAGDFVTADGKKAVEVASVDRSSSKNFDTVKLKAAAGAIAEGGFLTEAKGADDAAAKYVAGAVVGTGKMVEPKDNVITDAWMIGVTKGLRLPEAVYTQLKGIVNID